MMIAVHAMSGGAQAFWFGLALVLFLVGAALAALVKPRGPATIWPVLALVGLACFALVYCWNGAALS